MSTFFHVNTDFDIRLRNEMVSPRIQKAVEEMATLFIPALSPEDVIASPLTVPASYDAYLASLGLSTASLSAHNPGCDFEDSWGWRMADDTHPSLEAVKQVNSRAFSFQLISQLPSPIGAAFCIPCENLPLWVIEGGIWVAKPLFGSAGSGFVHGEGALELEEVGRSDEAWIVEPWLERITDIGTRIEIARDGTLTIHGHHRNITNRAGTFYAHLLASDDPEIMPWISVLNEQAAIIGRAVYEAGFWGIAGIDSFTYHDQGVLRFAGGFDINARHTIASLSYGIKGKLPAQSCFLYRFIARRRLALPLSYEELVTLFADEAYTPERGEGLLLLSPLQVTLGKEVRMPQRLAFGVVAPTIERTFALDETLRKRVLKVR